VTCDFENEWGKCAMHSKINGVEYHVIPKHMDQGTYKHYWVKRFAVEMA
jgi:hypothetical protein